MIERRLPPGFYRTGPNRRTFLQARGKGYRGDSEGVESIFGLEAGGDAATWANRPHNYARMQAQADAHSALDPALDTNMALVTAQMPRLALIPTPQSGCFLVLLDP